MTVYQSEGFGRIAGMIKKLLCLALLACLAPACDQFKPSPFASDALPSTFFSPATGIAHWPLIVLQWSEAMEPTTMTGSHIKIFDNVTPAQYGPSPTVIYLAGSMQSIVISGQSLASATATPGSGTYAVTTDGLCQSLVGGLSTPLAAEAFFTVVNDANATNIPPVFSTPSAAADTAAGKINIDFDVATVSGSSTNIVYDVYASTTLGGEDLFGAKTTVTNATAVANAAAAVPPLTVGKGRITFSSLTTGNIYYYLVVARDSSSGNVLATQEISATAP